MTIGEFYNKWTANNPVAVPNLVSILKVPATTPIKEVGANTLTKAIAIAEDRKLAKKKGIVIEPVIKSKEKVASVVKPVVKPVIAEKKEVSIFDKISQSVNNVIDYATRANIKYGFGDAANDNTQIMKNETVQIDVSKVSNKTVKQEKLKEKVESFYKELGVTKSGYMSYINVFDNSKGFNYVPTARIEKDSTYSNVKGMAHFLYDYDATNDRYANSSESLIQIGEQRAKGIKSTDIVKNYQPVSGTTVTNPYFAVITKNSDKTVNIKYKRQSEITNKDILADHLRQYRFTDLNWEGSTNAPTFNKTVAAIPTKIGSPSQLIYAKALGKDAYGKFGGGSVVFLIEGKNVAVDFAGSINQIKSQAETLIKNYNIKPEELIIAYHDLGSYSAKPKAVNDKIDSKRYRGFNTNKETGAGLAFPK